MKAEKDKNSTVQEWKENQRKAVKLAQKHSPDLDKLVRIQINSATHVFVTQTKLDVLGKEYFINKYLNRQVKIE